MTQVMCPKCGGQSWKAVEQFSALTPCTLERDEDGTLVTEFDMRAELAREAATSVTLAYICADENCGHTMEAA